MTAAEAGPAGVILDHVWVGAGIHIHTGVSAEEAREPFLPWRELPDGPDAVFALLSWRARLAPLVGREKDKDTLLQWARQGRNACIRLLTGPGGVGKSRLAAEASEALRADGWTAGFIRPNDPIVVPLSRAGLFLVVDYPKNIRTRCGHCCTKSRPVSCETSRCASSCAFPPAVSRRSA